MIRYILLLSITFAFAFPGTAATTKPECGKKEGVEYCYYPGDPASTRLVIFMHGYGDNVRSWTDHPPTVRIEKYWKDNGIARPNIISLSRGKWWYVEPQRGIELTNLLNWFEAGHFTTPPTRVLFGESMGGHNAYRWALDYPGLFHKVVLTCPAFPKFFVKDQPTDPNTGIWEWFANNMISGAYRDSSLPEFNPLTINLAEKADSIITKVHIVASDIDSFGFYDGDMALHRQLSKDPAIQATVEVQRINHCEIEEAGTAKFLVEE